MSKTVSRLLAPVATGVLCAGLFGALLAPSARADEWNQKTRVTVDQPVEVPGAVLTPGTYIFKLMDSTAERKVVQVYNGSGTHLITTFQGIPMYRQSPSSHTILRFNESTANNPQTLHEWFYPGHNYGLKFVYPHSVTGSAD